MFQTMNKSNDASARAGISSSLLAGKGGTCNNVKLYNIQVELQHHSRHLPSTCTLLPRTSKSLSIRQPYFLKQ